MVVSFEERGHVERVLFSKQIICKTFLRGVLRSYLMRTLYQGCASRVLRSVWVAARHCGRILKTLYLQCWTVI